MCWRYLSFRAVASQVLSTEMSLTTVFGMGTGGPSSNQHQLYVIGHCPKTNYIILSSAPFVKSLLTLVTPPRNQRQRFETEKEAFSRPARAVNQRSVCSAIGEK